MKRPRRKKSTSSFQRVVLNVNRFEDRNAPDDLFGLAQGALTGVLALPEAPFAVGGKDNAAHYGWDTGLGAAVELPESASSALPKGREEYTTSNPAAPPPVVAVEHTRDLNEDLWTVIGIDPFADPLGRAPKPEVPSGGSSYNPLPENAGGGGNGSAAGDRNIESGVSGGGGGSEAPEQVPTGLGGEAGAAAHEGPGQVAHSLAPSATTQPRKRFLHADYGQNSLRFEPNRGQTYAGVQYLARGQGYDIFVSATETAISLQKPLRPVGAPETAPPTERAVVRVQLVGANPSAAVKAEEPLSSYSNYFLGNNPSQWRKQVPHFGRLTYQNVWPGIDVTHYGNQRQLEYDFNVRPGGVGLSAIRFNIEGASTLRLDTQGNLILATRGGDVTHRAPVLYQLSASGARQTVLGSYVLLGPTQVGLVAGLYDTSRSLYVDPIIQYGSYLGGTGADYGYGVVVDGTNNVWVAGQTSSPSIPAGGSTALQGAADAFAAKYYDNGTLAFVTYLGGTNDTLYDSTNGEGAVGIAVDPSYNVYLVGRTNATDFPVSTGAFQTTNGGGWDGFVAQVDFAGNLRYGTYLGGSGLDWGAAVAVDGNSDVYVVGRTASTNFPLQGAFQTTNGGSDDVFLTKLTPGLAGLFSSYLGGSQSDLGLGIAVDEGGSAYLVGQTNSSNFPLKNPIQSTLGGTRDSFITKVDTLAATLTYSTFHGGAAEDVANAIAIDQEGSAYLVGRTKSSDFPLQAAYDSSLGGTQDSFVTKINAAGSARVYSTFLGGSGDDEGFGIAVNGVGEAHVTGYTSTSDFPIQPTSPNNYGGGKDAFFSGFNAAGSGLWYSTHLGGSSDDYGRGIALDADSNFYLAGYTSSTNFPVSGQFQGGSVDGFMVKYGLAIAKPKITGITNDTGLSSSDNNTNNQQPGIKGTGIRASTVKVKRSDGWVVGTATTQSDGTWQVPITTNQPEGGYSFTATQTKDNSTSDASPPMGVIIDLTNPKLKLICLSGPYDRKPRVLVTATDNFGLPPNNTNSADYLVRVFVNGTQAATGMLQNNRAIIELPEQPLNTNLTIEAKLRDLTGNDGTSNSCTINRPPVPDADKWKITAAQQLSWDPLDGMGLEQTGNVQIRHPLDLDKSPGTSVSRNPALVYNSETVSVRPIVQTTIQSDNPDSTWPTSVDLKFWWKGTLSVNQAGANSSDTQLNVSGLPSGLTDRYIMITGGQGAGQERKITGQGSNSITITSGSPNAGEGSQFEIFDANPIITPPTNFSLGGVGKGKTFTVAAQVPAGQEVTQTGSYPWRVEVVFNGQSITTKSAVGLATAVVRDSSVFGDGWSFSLYDQLLRIPADTGKNEEGQLRVYGTGSWRFYTKNGSNYNSELGDSGKLALSSGTYTYTTLDGERWLFDSGGKLTSIINADGTETLSFNHTGSQLDGITTPDGATSTFGYSSGKVTSITAVTSRVTTLQRSGSETRLSGITDAAGGLRSFTYQSDSPNRLITKETYTNSGPTRGTFVQSWAYSNNALATHTLGDLNVGSTNEVQITKVTPAAVQGLAAAVPETVKALVARVTDSADQETFWTLSPRGRPTEKMQADGGRWIWTRGSHTFVTQFEDPLARLTTYVRDTPPALVLTEKLPAAGATPVVDERVYTYQNFSGGGVDTRYRMMTSKDERGNFTTYTYTTDGLGRLETVRDADNKLTTYAYYTSGTENGLVKSVTNRRNVVTTYGYDSSRRQNVLIEAQGVTGVERKTTQIYDTSGNVQSITTGQSTVSNYQHEVTTTYSYDGMNRQTSMTEAAGQPEDRTTTTEYTGTGQVYRAIDPLGRVSLNIYDSADRIREAYEAHGVPVVGRRTDTAYNKAGYARTVLNPRGVPTNYGYDMMNRVTLVTEAKGDDTRTTETQYDPVGNVITRIDALERVTETQYDARNRATTVIESRYHDTEQRTTITNFDPAGNVLSVDRPRNYDHQTSSRIVTSYLYDTLNRQTQMIEAHGGLPIPRTTTTLYDAEGNVVSVTTGIGTANEKKVRTDYVYDELNRRKETTEAANDAAVKRTATVQYDAAGNTRAQTTGLQGGSAYEKPVVTTYLYDKLSRQLEVTEAANGTASEKRTTTTVYDDVGNVTKVIDAQSQETTYLYDALNRQRSGTRSAQITPPSDVRRTVTTIYDAGNLVRLVIEPAVGGSFFPRWTLYTYDGLGRRTHVRDQQGYTTRAIYDLVDNVKVVTDAAPAPNATVFEHDSHNRVTREQNAADLVTRAGATARTFTYDASNNRTAATDRENRERRFAFDLLNRVTTETWHPSPGSGTTSRTLTFVYDAQNNLIGASDYNNAATTMVSKYAGEHDLLGRNTLSSNDGTPNQAKVETVSTYNAASERTDLTVRQTSTITYFANTYTNDILSRTTKIVQTGTGVAVKRVELAYNKLDQFTTIKRRSVDSDTGTLVATSDYTYETGSTRPAELKHTAAQTRAYTFTHDPGDRISKIVSADGTNDYTHNRRSELLTASLDSESYGYDGAGNRTGYTIDPNNELKFDGTNTYTYDKKGNRETKVDSSGTTTYTWDQKNRLTQVQTTTVTVDYKYDLFDRRIERAVAGGATQRWGYDGDSIVLETDGSNAVTHRYLQGPVIDQIFADEKIGASSTYWPLTDHLGTVRDLVNNSGSPLNHIRYDSFGKRLTAEDPEGDETLYSFTGRERDVETGLYYYRARYYDPAVGTFVSVDPSGFDAGDSNLYRYVKNGPTGATDPSGLQPPIVDALGKDVKKTYFEPPPAPPRQEYPPKYVDKKGSGVIDAEQDKKNLDAIRESLRRPVVINAPSEKWAPAPATEYLPKYKKDYSLQPLGFWESMIPVYGPMGNAFYHFDEGEWGWGLLNLGMAVGDAFGVGYVARGGGKLLVKGGTWLFSREAAPATVQRVTQFYNPARGSFGPGATEALLAPAETNLLGRFVNGSGGPRTWVSPFAASEQTWWTRMWTGRPTYRHYVEFDVAASELRSVGGAYGWLGLGRYQQYILGPAALAERNAVCGQLGPNYGYWLFWSGLGLSGGGRVKKGFDQ